MTLYHSVHDVFEARRKGANLSVVFDALLHQQELWENYGPTPFSILQGLDEADHLDMTTPTWRQLAPRQQIELATSYQWWYAHQLGLTDVEHSFFDGVTIIMRLIPPMRYNMGSPETTPNLLDWERQVPIWSKKPFWIGQCTIMRKQWSALFKNWDFITQESPSMPMVYVTHTNCLEFCKKTKTRLPEEWEWELACRAGTTSAYSFGYDPEQLANYAWYSNNSNFVLHRPKEKASNAFGIYDMHGNVWEWCQTQSNPKYKPHLRLIRGGSYGSDYYECRSASKQQQNAELDTEDVGFRVVRDL